MLRAFAVKGVAVAVGVALWWVLPPGVRGLAIAALAAAVVGFVAYAIAHPRSGFFVPVVSRIAGAAPVVALTFDDGPDPEVTPAVLDRLAAHGARATFFVLGERAAKHPALVRRIAREGHAIGTHTQHHRVRFHFAGPAYVLREIESAIAAVGDIVGRRPALFRPPQGLRTPTFASGWRRTRGLVCVTWTVRGLDSLATTADAIVARVTRRLAPGAIVALHDGTGLGGARDRRPTLAALDAILAACQARRLACVALDDTGGAAAADAAGGAGGA